MKRKLSINKRKKSKIGTILYNHIINNKRGYLIVSILFFIGLIIGVLFINNAKEVQINEINNYLENLVQQVNKSEVIDYINMLKESIISNFIIIILLWFGASTIIGIPIVYGTVIFKGFTIGYTISSIIICFGLGKGMLAVLSILLLHNVILIPTMFAASVSGLKLYKSIMKNKDRNNIKIEILRHTIFCALMLILMIIASLIETYISTNIFIFLVSKT